MKKDCKYYNEALCALVLSRLPGVGAAKFKFLIDQFKVPSLALEEYTEQLNFSFFQKISKQSYYKSRTNKELDEAYLDLINNKVKITWYGKEDYPVNLTSLSEPPPILFFKGYLPQEKKMVSIVGTRKCYSISVVITQQITKELVKKGYTIVSGGAIGIDTVAHKTAVEQKGSTVAILGSGVNILYPKSNQELFGQIISTSGAVMSELLPSAKPQRGFFPTRNRIIAGLSPATIIVQAPTNSGALITAKYALKFRRRVFVYSPSKQITSVTNLDGWIGNNQLAKLSEINTFSTIDELCCMLNKLEI